jgi:hypothetical protein
VGASEQPRHRLPESILDFPRTSPRPPQHPSPQRAPVAPVPPAQPAPAPPLTDEQYLDGRDPSLIARWSAVGGQEQERLASILKRLPPPADDFARIPYPQIAGVGGAGIAAAVQQYKDEAKVVDARLFRKVTLQDKGVALSDFCAELQEQTGVKLSASRAVADEKVTVFVKEEPARGVMRAVAHLFGYFWLRSGHEGEYRYELDQDLKAQLAEDEMRRRDQDAALVAMDKQAQTFGPYQDLTFEEFHNRWDRLPQSQQNSLFNCVANGGWGGMQLYRRLGPRDQAALLAGQQLIFRPDAPNPERRLSPEFAHRALMAWNPRVRFEDRPVGELPGARVRLMTLKINRTELGRVSLVMHMSVAWKGPSGGELGGGMTFDDSELATGQSPSVAKPDNARANAALRGQSPFDEIISLHPEPTCPQVRLALKNHTPRLPYAIGSAAIGDIQLPHVFSADVWEAVHRATGLPVVADYYTRMIRLDAVTVEQKPLFDALCRVGDALGARWRKEGDFLLGRSSTYYWDKRKEVPNRYLLRWLQEKRDRPGLSIDSLLEMVSLPEEVLNSRIVGEAIQHCWGLQEWGMVMPNPFRGDTPGRHYPRLLAELTPEHRRRTLAPGGLPLTELTPAEQQAFLRTWNAIGESHVNWTGDPPPPPDVEHGHLVVEYVPAGWYVWTPPESSPENPWPRGLHRIAGRTAAEALAAARRIDPAATAKQVTLLKDGEFRPYVSF